MAHKDAFLNSLSDEQLGIFYAYEYNDNLDDILQDYITPIQYSLFMKWKNNEAVAPIENAAATTNNADSAKLDNLLSVVNNITTMLVGLNERMDNIESKITTVELNQKNHLDEVSSDISSLKQKFEDGKQQIMQELSLLKMSQPPTVTIESITPEKLETTSNSTSENNLSDTLLSLKRDKVKEDLQIMLKQMKDSSVTKEIKEETCNKDIIEKILKDMKRYKKEEEIEKNSTEIMYNLSDVSENACMNIIESGILEYLKELFVSYWPTRNEREDTLKNILFVFYNISWYSTDKHLMKDSFFELFMLPFADSNFSNFNIIAGNLLSNLLSVEDEEWTVTMTKAQVDNLLIENIGKWQLGLFNPFTLTSFELRLQQISKSGVKSHKLLYSWDMANQLTADLAKYTELLKKEEQTIKMLEELVTKESTDAEVKKLLQVCLDVLQK